MEAGALLSRNRISALRSHLEAQSECEGAADLVEQIGVGRDGGKHEVGAELPGGSWSSRLLMVAKTSTSCWSASKP
jgi:hypothetical protein